MTHVAPLGPMINTLSRDECLRLLTQHDVGRLAFAFNDRVDIEPIHFIYNNGWLYGRTSEGTKADVIAHNRWVAFEVDEVRGTFDWVSVVVKGAFYRLDANASTQAERVAADLGAALLENVVPNTLGVGDPVPWRKLLFRVYVDEITGRRAIPGA